MPTVPKEQVDKATGALLAFLAGEIKGTDSKSKKSAMFEQDEYFNLIITLRKVPDNDSLKPKRIAVPHSVYGRDGVTFCFISKDPQAQWEEFVDENPVRGLKEVVSMKKLRTDFKAFEHRRALQARHELFLCDSAIVPMLPPLLGSKFFKAKKQPFPIDLSDGEKFRAKVAAARDSVFLFLSRGTAVNIRVAHSDMTREQIVANVLAAIEGAVEQIPRKWANIQALHLKTATSVALPLYNAVATVADHEHTAEDTERMAAEAARVERSKLHAQAERLGLTLNDYLGLKRGAEERGLTVAQYRLLRRARFALGEGLGVKTVMSAEKAEAIVRKLTVENPKYVDPASAEAEEDKEAEFELDDEGALLGGGDSDDDDEEEEEEEEQVRLPAPKKGKKAAEPEPEAPKKGAKKAAAAAEPVAPAKAGKKAAAAAAVEEAPVKSLKRAKAAAAAEEEPAKPVKKAVTAEVVAKKAKKAVKA